MWVGVKLERSGRHGGLVAACACAWVTGIGTVRTFIVIILVIPIFEALGDGIVSCQTCQSHHNEHYIDTRT
jgi:hypothetical protein